MNLIMTLAIGNVLANDDVKVIQQSKIIIIIIVVASGRKVS